MNILVTGATSGFGEQIARDFVATGHTVYGTGRRADRLAALQDELGERFLPVCFDVADSEATVAALTKIDLSAIDVLVNNAGLALGLEPAHRADSTDWQTMIDVNIKGLVTVTHLLLPHMVAKNSGTIINIGSTAGNHPYFGANVYGASKAFVKQFSNNLRADLLGVRVRVTNIEPGLCGGTEFSNVRFKGDDDKAAAVYEQVAYLTAQDISNAVQWVASLPWHVNINSMELMPTAQTYAGLTVARGI
ncbi:3-hydroxy acid dehydrogenase / malonic semialdehyde reductase [Moraxella cuniculi DSM 21768]|uniref:3-hydroxy acid dehydrogenase / malonic semialdehyde reductase n=1 Tax=Moraxella cuniculi DSM 21768 TaxID=1122245 RepID=A0A1N7E6R8_9GAMM|nr:SDR family NAD(P)-dependent oxidoreductase [Moraxella cuniculi]OOS06644.1 NADP-dependent 3-hydroxy acid dehydrogenase [Moraxella cuniculi]SIR83729.1 3-hydroxy acid dehydrogenase / malonic semialdehyde reductase [Moraxella cuniculi DSM 21768]